MGSARGKVVVGVWRSVVILMDNGDLSRKGYRCWHEALVVAALGDSASSAGHLLSRSYEEVSTQ